MGPMPFDQPDPPTPRPGLFGTSEELLPLVYDELRRMARARSTREPMGVLLQPAELVHEAYLRFGGPETDDAPWDRRGSFFTAAAQAMRRILVERARARGAGRRGRGAIDAEATAVDGDANLAAIDEALDELTASDPRKAQVVMLRYFAGLSLDEVARAMDLSPATVTSEWAHGCAWLNRAMAGGPA